VVGKHGSFEVAKPVTGWAVPAVGDGPPLLPA